MKGWLDNFGKADNANDSKVSMSEDFVGLGYDTKGRNYSPAWGGQFAMGGSIPGSVGFTYARVAGAAPSKGKYAKKTMASAQNGIIADKIAGLELQQNPEYQRLKYLQSLPQLRQSPGLLEKILGPADSDLVKAADIATDIMQLGNFIPHPIAQGIGKIGNVAGTALDSYQAAASFYKGDNVGGVVNAASAVLPSFLGANTFRRPAMNLRPGDPLYSLTEQATKPYALNLAKPSTDYLEVFSKVKKMKDNSLLYNRALLGALGAETAYDVLSQTSSPNVISSSDIEGVYPSSDVESTYPKSQPLSTKTESADPAIAKKLADYMKSKSKEKTGEVYGRKSYYPIDGFENGGEIPSAQNGIMSPMLLARNVLNYFYPSEEATSTVGAAPVEYKKGLTDELLKRQAYKESTFNPAAVSPAGYKGLTQIGEEVLTDYSKKKGGKKLDPFNPKDAVELQKFAMDDLYNASFINKPDQPDSVRLAKTLAAYNWGRGNLFNYLNEQKQKGVDIYDSYDWLNDLPKETSDYVNKILLQEDQSFNKNYKRDSTNPKYKDVTSLYDKKRFGGKVTTAQNGQEMRFYQNGLDWKPKSMQDGGKIYEGQELPEFVVEGKDDRLKQAMYEGSNRFLQGLVGVMGSPQTGLMEVITGKQQTPSQAFGFQDTGGWLDSPKSFGKNLSNLAMDVVLDPINLLGVGIADDIARTTVKGLSKKAASKELPSKVGKITGLRAGVTAGDVNDLVDKNINYIESDEYLQRRMATTGESKEQVLKDVSKYKDRLKNTTINLSASGEGGLMDPLNIPYLTNKKIKVGKGITDKEEVLGVLDHEIKHMLSPASEFPLFSPNTTSGDRLGKYFNYPELEINSPVGKYDYFRDPMEQQVRMLKLNEKIRQDLGIKDIRKITEKEFDSWKSKHLDETLNNPRYRDFKQIYEDATDKGRSDLLNTLNRLWAAPAIGVVSAQAIEQKKDGGFVKQFQDGGTEKISINDPRYPELHKNRQVGAYYDGAFTLPDLPEVTVTAPRSYTMDSLRDFTTAALYGAPAAAMKLSMIPQAAMTEGIEALRGEPYDFSNVNPNFGGFTSNQRDLSQTMGYENPEGFLQNAVNFGLSAIDPMILSGASKVVGKQLARKAVPEFIPEKIVFDLMDESIDPFAQVLKNVKIHDTPSPFAKDVQREAFKYQKLARDPRYLERVKNIDRDFGSRLEPLLNQFKNDEIQNVNQYFPFNISIVDEIPHSFGGEPVDVLGISSLNTEGSLKNAMNKGVKYPQKITPSTDRYIEINEPRHLRENAPARGTVHHELKHHWTNALLDTENKNYEQALRNLIARRSEAGIDPRDVAANQDYNYLSRGTEVDAHLMTNLRDEMVNRGYLKDHFDELSESRLNDFLSKEKDYRGVREYFNPLKPMVTDKSKFVDFFNKYGLPSTVIGGVLGGQAIDQQRNGGITKDNQGYWNPDNWGKPVEIDSNNITMEGVYEPLLGVSDTGDAKLMKPGKNYKFKGKKVTEFPVAKLGINQLDAQPMKKLNQLLNFTNNPDKDNWLDKYN